jgi:hypothetical protein
MELTQLNKHSTLTEEEYIATVLFKGVEIPFRVLKTTSISYRGTSFTAVSIKKVSDKPNITKGQKEKIREIIQCKLLSNP